jgi:phage shock protein A
LSVPLLDAGFKKKIISRCPFKGQDAPLAEDEEVTESTKTLSPEELQIKSLRVKAQQYKDQADGVKARYSLTKAKERLNSYNYNQSRKLL